MKLETIKNCRAFTSKLISRRILGAALILGAPGVAQSALTITITEAPGGANVRALGSLNLDPGDRLISGMISLGDSIYVDLDPGDGALHLVSCGCGSSLDLYPAVASGDLFPAISINNGGGLVSGGFGGNDDGLLVPFNYIGGTLIDESGFIAGAVFGPGLLSDGLSRTYTYTGTAGSDTLTIQTRPIPEPSSSLLGVLGAGGMLLRRRRRG